MKSLFLTLCSCLAVFAADPVPVKPAGGPYVVNVTSESATIVWLVPGKDGAAAPRVESRTLTGLTADTKYEDNITGGTPEGKVSFRTPPLGAVPFTFVAYGDNRTRNDVHRRVVEAILRHGVPDFVVQTGDMVANGPDTTLWPVFFDIEKDLLRQTAFFPSLGNHERNTPLFGRYFLKPKPYYSFDWGNAHFSVIDSDIGTVSSVKSERDAFWAEQTQWLEEDLRGHADADFRFVVAHHPPITAVARRQGDNPHMIALMPMFEKYRVSAGLFGHDHNFQHYLKNGIHYVISGGGGAPLYDVDKPAPEITRKVASIENFVAVRVNGAVAHVQAIAPDGHIVDEFDIHGGTPK